MCREEMKTAGKTEKGNERTGHKTSGTGSVPKCGIIVGIRLKQELTKEGQQKERGSHS